ncbi:unnamed protein product [Cylindrotheca closterium]|uniref:Protein xylosyltransferase n=1 Tax=Cylindrotheca closterium TaxID=2856 RepID=A0AAD2GDF3_9STRA|nr:unnamed protein product [Cylindrotheca closterium]
MSLTSNLTYALVFACLIAQLMLTYRMPIGPNNSQSLDIEAKSLSASKCHTENTARFEDDNQKLPNTIFLDPHQPYQHPLTNDHLLGKYSKHEGHEMDVVVMAAHPDATLAACIHNLYHLNGFRRFIFVVNDAADSCPTIFDLMPQHDTDESPRKHHCLQHTSFYTKAELKYLFDPNGPYAAIIEGPPELIFRNGQYVKNPRMGWYLQQFSKLMIPRLIPDLSEHFLTIDGDIMFTRPKQFVVAGSNSSDPPKYVIPKTRIPPLQWSRFVNLTFPDLEAKKSNSENNYVVGWMMFDRDVTEDIIAAINKILSRKGYPGSFPFNVLRVGEELIKTNEYFSEYYTYGLFALNHTKPHVPNYHGRPLRNTGILDSCILKQSAYTEAQESEKRPPWAIWEEHKYLSQSACVEPDSVFKFTTIGIIHDQEKKDETSKFLLDLSSRLSKLGMDVIVSNDQNAESLDKLWNASQVVLAETTTFSSHGAVLEGKKRGNRLAFIEYRKESSSSAKDVQNNGSIGRINRHACTTIFSSRSSFTSIIMDSGEDYQNPILIPTTTPEKMDELTREYLSIMRWCFYMRHNLPEP